MHLTIYQRAELEKITAQRPGETHIGETIRLLSSPVASYQALAQALKDATVYGIRYVILGIPEDIGPRANCGRAGAEHSFAAFLQHFCNLQDNQHLNLNACLLLGEVALDDLQKQSAVASLNQLRALTEQIDTRVEAVLSAIFAAGLEPIIIGGGHNNCYPILKALAAHSGKAANAINLDPHADFRALEGRHSGNGFHYAKEHDALGKYHVIGLDEFRNNQAIFDALNAHKVGYTSHQALFYRQTVPLPEALTHALEEMKDAPLGIEVDVDAIQNVPASAYTYVGVSHQDANYYVYTSAKANNATYLHLAEAAPSLHPVSQQEGERQCGQILSSLVLSYLQGRSAFLNSHQ